MEAAERQLFAIDGLFCGGCARGLETRLRALEGVIEAGVQFLTATALVRWHPSRCDPKAIEACISSAGYRLVVDQTLGAREQRLEKLRRDLVMRLSIALFFGMWAMGAALVLYLPPGLDSVTAWWIACASGVLSAPVIGWAGAPLLEMALRAAWMRSASIDLLIGISVASAVLASIAMLVAGSSHVYFDAAVMLVSLRLLGQWVEARLRSDALAAIRTIEALAPETACGNGTARLFR